MSGAKDCKELGRLCPDAEPRLVHEIVSKVAGAIQKPVTVKIRKGFDDDHVNAVEIAKIIEDAGGVQWLCTAGRGNSITPESRTGILSVR